LSGRPGPASKQEDKSSTTTQPILILRPDQNTTQQDKFYIFVFT
jgi:hypothetical protein